MSYELVAGDPIPPIPPASSREPWPEGQVYIAHDANETKKLWDEWSREDAYPLVFRQNLELKPEYKTLRPKVIVNADKTLKEELPKGRFVLPEGFYEYTNNGYSRGGIAWCATYLHVARLLGHKPPDVVFNTSDFDPVGCTMKSERTPNFPDIPEYEYDDIDAFLWYQEESGTRPDRNVPEAWPGHYIQIRANFVTFYSHRVVDVTNYKSSYSGYGEPRVSWKKLASFFDDRLMLNDKKLTEKEIDETDAEHVAKKYGLDDSDQRHEKGNLDSLPARYGLADAVPYLMRVKGFGFVETPTIQVGQLIDTLSDYKRCGNQEAVGIKAKYRRRLERLEHSWDLHVALSRAGYRHGPESPSNSPPTTPFVLSTVVADELRDLVRSQAWRSFFRATDPQDNNNCRRAEVNEDVKEVVMRESVACDKDIARMNCKRMLGHPFKDKTKNGGCESYATQDEWSVRLGESLQPMDPKRKL
jgi:hypothetical protein